MMNFQIHIYDELTSTNDEAKRLARAGAPEGAVVRAFFQTEGRGRLGRAWSGENGTSLMFSVVLRPALATADAAIWTLAAGLGVCRALSQIMGEDVRVKWPNDVVIDGRKLCGILSEQSIEGDRVQSVVTGIGINVNQECFDVEIREKAVSMRMIANRVFSADEVLAAVLAELDAVYAVFVRDGFGALAAEYNALCINTGAAVRIENACDVAEGIARGVDAAGWLVVDVADGECMRVSSGEVSVRLANGRYA